MLVRAKQLQIDPKNPFALDKLGRVESATILTHLLGQVDTPFVLGIDAKWGDGKTTFVQMWKHHLAASGIRSLYFNAWESDYSSDPLISFIGEMGGQLERQGDIAQSTRLSEKWIKVKDTGAFLAKRLLPVAVKVGTAGVIDLAGFTEESIAGLAADLAKEKIESYESDKTTVKDFKKRLEEFIRELGGQEQEGRRPPVVFLVDELDRCRPTYTVELLERIKHFFDVEGLVFVLSLDKEQLGHAIRAVYGSGIDVDGYLRRFVDLEYRFPQPSRANFLSFLADQHQLAETLMNTGHRDQTNMIDVSIQTFDRLAMVFGLSLRAQEQCFATLIIALLITRLEVYLPFMISLLAIRTGNRNLYERFVSSKSTFRELLEVIEASPWGKKFLAEDAGLYFEANMIGWKQGIDTTADDKVAHYTNIVNAAQGKHVEAPRARRILEHVQSSTNFHALATAYVKAFEITGSFKIPPIAPTGVKVQ